MIDELEAAIEEHEPIDRRDLHDEAFVEALWEYTRLSSNRAQIPVNAWHTLMTRFDTDGNIFLSELRTALHIHGCEHVPASRRSKRMEHDIRGANR